MTRFRMIPTAAQEAALLGHCAHARFMWNLALEQWAMWSPTRRGYPPGYVEQARQLTDARAENAWLRLGSQTVQQQALRDFDRACASFYAGAHGRPTWRKARVHEGFRIVGAQAQRVEQISRRRARVLVPKVGWVKFRLSRALPAARSYRITLDRAGRWHIAFAVVPPPIPSPQTGAIVGVDRGVVASVALSTGELLICPGLRPREARRLLRLERRFARAQRGSRRRSKIKSAIARMRAKEADRRRNWVEQTTTDLARRFDTIRIEDLRITQMTRTARGTAEKPGRNVRAKAGLNRAIRRQGWGLLARRLEHKAAGRLERVRAAYTSLTCSRCGTVDREARENQATFRCRSCGFAANADVNAATNIAAGRAVTARGAGAGLPVAKREPQFATST